LFPPAPTVEDESESIAKEYGSVLSVHPDEEPKHPGEWNQASILEDLRRPSEHVSEHDQVPNRGDNFECNQEDDVNDNLERRFICKNTSLSASDQAREDQAREELKKAARARRAERKNERSSPSRDEEAYGSNTCRKYVWVPPKGEDNNPKPEAKIEEHDEPRNREKRKNRLGNLPTIVTDLDLDERHDIRQKDLRRSRSAAGGEGSANDYFSPRYSSQRRPEESLLSPDVIKHSTKGRDRVYYDYTGATSPSRRRNGTNEDDPLRERRYQEMFDDGPTGSHSAGPANPRKTAEAPRNVRRTSKEGSASYDSQDHSAYDKPRQYLERPKKTSRANSASSTRPDYEFLHQRSPSFKSKRPSPPYDDSKYSSGEETDKRPGPRRRGNSFVHEERNRHFSTSLEPKSPGRRSRPNTPLASPRVSQSDLFPEPVGNAPSRSPRSATFPVNREHQIPEPKFPAEEESPSRPLSRASTSRSMQNPAASMTVPALVVAAADAAATQDSGTFAERRSADVRMPSKPLVPADARSNSRSSSTPSSSSPTKPSWQPPKFDPYKDGIQPDLKNGSYRKYSEGHIGDLPSLPDCHRTKEEAGHMDWLTLPKCNKFNICSPCYQAAFGSTGWRNKFVPAPFRSREMIKCNFGASLWYHIAWWLMQSNPQPDLRMFQNLISVTEAYQPCTGNQPALRIWYTIKDPVTQRPVRGFKTCHHCAKSIETLLPNLSGVFVPMDSPAEVKNGICSMHQQLHDGTERKRFLLFWEVMETTAERALASHRAPDIRALADRVRDISLTDECQRSQPISDRKWYTMRSMPFFTVCEECYDEVVLAERDSSSIQAEFYKKPQRLEFAACQLYSERMRRHFREAVYNDDLEYFRSKVMRRKQKEQEFHDKIRSLDVNVLGKERVEEEIEKARKDWSRHE
jgi:hypothetical protein